MIFFLCIYISIVN